MLKKLVPALIFGLALSACAQDATTTIQQAAYTAEGAYFAAAHLEVIAAGQLSAGDKDNMKNLDKIAYNEIVTIRQDAQAGTLPTMAQIQQANTDITSLVNFLKGKGFTS